MHGAQLITTCLRGMRQLIHSADRVIESSREWQRHGGQSSRFWFNEVAHNHDGYFQGGQAIHPASFDHHPAMSYNHDAEMTDVGNVSSQDLREEAIDRWLSSQPSLMTLRDDWEKLSRRPRKHLRIIEDLRYAVNEGELRYPWELAGCMSAARQSGKKMHLQPSAIPTWRIWYVCHLP